MRKLLAFLVLLMLPWVARAQALADWYYWFDYDSSPKEIGKVVGQQFQLQPDISHLAMGVHTLYVQVVDTAGVYSTPVGSMFFKVPDASTIDKLFYTIDAEETPKVLDFGNGSFTLDVSKYQTGFHRITLQVMDRQSGVSDVMHYMFYKAPQNNKLAEFRYWFDSDATVRTMPYGQGHYILDVAHLIPGFHFINYYVADGEEKMTKIDNVGFFRLPLAYNQKLHYWFDGDSIATEIPNFQDGFIVDVTRLQEGFNTIYFQLDDNGPTDIMMDQFIKIPQTENGGDMTLVCIVDGKVVGEEKVAAHGGMVKCDMDVSNMEVGLHKAMFQLVTPSGAGSSIAETYFIRTLSNAEVSTMQCNYTIDGFLHRVHKGTYTNGVFHFDLPVEDVENGLHRIDYLLVADNGSSTAQGSAWFFKTPVGGNCITQYDYWLNNKNDDVHSVTLEETKDPFQLIKLLPITKEPIRSSCFHFEVKDEKPIMYAKNDIHFRFHDKSGRWVDADKQYVDYNISFAVTDAIELRSTQTFTRPNENGIKWFKFDAAPGDTIGFKASQATSLQVFAPSGKEIISTMGDKSVQYTGAHTWENGTYYVAVHDVTGSKPNVTLDYMHMDKYDVVDQDVRAVGNGGCSTITFQGNGFKDLYSVDLKDLKGNVIQSIDVGHESDATTTVTFDFTDTKLGKYNAVFHFTEEDKTFANSITVEEAKEIELVNTVTYNGNFLLGRDADFTLKVVNKSNMTAYSVPVQIEVRSGKSVENIKNIKVACNRFTTPDNYISLIDSIDPVLKDLLTDALPKLGTLSDFFVLVDEDGQLYYRAEYSMTLLPNSETVITTSVSSQQTTEVYYIVPSDWAALSMKPINNARRMARAKGLDAICCNKERIKCVANIANLIGGFTPYGCATSIGNEIVEQTLEGMCPDEGQVKKSLNKKVKSIAGSIMNVLIDCVTGHFDDLAKGIRKALKGIEEQIANVSKQISKLSQERDEAYQSYRYLQKKATEAFNNHDAEAYKICMDQADEALRKGQSLDNEIAGLRRQKDDLLTQQAIKNKDLLDCKEGLSNAIKGIRDSMADMITESSCYKAFKESISNCPPPYPGGGGSTPVTSYDPNDIYGYIAPSRSMFVGDEVVTLPYRIEFENDTTFATSSAHTVIVKNTLDAKVFDFSSYQPTSVKIGDKDVQLKGEKEFVTTVDMRPAINVIAQVEGKFDEKKGIATWTFSSLDPMTMEPTDDIMQGFLPVNYDGSGIGEVAYNINRKASLSDGTEISNKASITFDTNDAIETPVWTNIVDAVPPVAHVNEAELVNDTIVRVHFDGDDNRSGIWKYALYVQYGEASSWFEVAETDTTCFDLRYYEDINYGFCVVATDAAGNVEKKIIQREYSFLNGEGEMTDAISSPKADHIATNRAYDLSGRLIQEEGYRGVIIKNKKKWLRR